jgi:hypothetical protein
MPSTASKVLNISAVALEAVGAVAAHAKTVLGGSHTVDQLSDIAKMLVAVVEAVRHGLETTATAADVEASLTSLLTGITSNNSIVDAMIDEKFKQG